MEPIDAFSGRFERAVELILGPLLKSLELVETGETSDTLRDRLNLAARLGLVSDPELWLEMRAARNRIAHDYLPERIQGLYHLLHTTYRDELAAFPGRMDAYLKRRGTEK